MEYMENGSLSGDPVHEGNNTSPETTGEKTETAFTGQIVKAVLGKDEFVLNDNGVYLVEINENRIKPLMLVCSPLKIIADTRDINGENWGRMAEFRDKDGKLQQYTMKMQDLRRDGEETVENLLSRGLSIAPGKKARLRLIEYVQNSQPENNRKARSTDMTGWHDKQFVLANDVIGEGEELIIYQGRQPETGTYAEKECLEEWRDNVASLCTGNSRLVLAVSTTLAAPLIPFVCMESGGFHFVGNSSTGKSTALYVAASVMGKPEHYIQSWRATSNGLEGVAKFHNDTCLMLDELSQVQPKEAGEVAYMLANGAGKLRANIRGEARHKASWRLLFLSSGEITLADHMSEGGKKTRAGQENRLVDILADAGREMGIFENLHGYANGAVFSERLKTCATLYHGTAFREFIRQVIANHDIMQVSIEELQEEFFDGRIPENASGQVRRVANRFSLVAAAGELATRYGITGWEKGESINAAATCFQSWLDQRGGVGNQETRKLLEQVRGFFEKHGDSRFISINFIENGTGFAISNEKHTVMNRAGFRLNDTKDRTSFLVLPAAFHEICEGFNIRTAAKILIEKGILTPADNGRTQKTRRLPGMGPTKFYHINGSIWEETQH
jgi:putative DNA primase/helicase